MAKPAATACAECVRNHGDRICQKFMTMEGRLREIHDIIRRGGVQVFPTWLSHQEAVLRMYYYAVTRGSLECIIVLQRLSPSPLPRVTVGFPDFGTMKWLDSRGLLEIGPGTLDHAASIGCKDCMQWLLERGHDTDEETVLAAARGGDPAVTTELVVRYFAECHFALDTLCHHGHELAILAIQNRLTSAHLSILARQGHLKILQQLDLSPFSKYESIPAAAIEGRQYEAFQYLVGRDFRMGEQVMTESAYKGYIHGMRVSANEGTEVTPNTFSAACMSGKLACVRFVAQNLGFAYDFQSIANRAMQHCAEVESFDDSVACGQYLIALGAKCNEHAIRACIRKDNIWLLESAFRANALETTPEVFSYRPRSRAGNMCLDFLEKEFPREVEIAMRGVIDSDDSDCDM